MVSGNRGRSVAEVVLGGEPSPVRQRKSEM